MGNCAKAQTMGSGGSTAQGSAASRLAGRVSDNASRPVGHATQPPTAPRTQQASQLANQRQLASANSDKDAVRTYNRLANPAHVMKDTVTLKEGAIKFKMQSVSSGGEWRVEIDPGNFDCEPRCPQDRDCSAGAFDVHSTAPQWGKFVAGLQEIKVPNAFAKLIQGTGVIQITVWPTDPGGDILSEKTIINVVDGKIAVAKDCDKKTPYIQRLAVKREDGDVVNVEVQNVYRGADVDTSTDDSECVICLSKSCTVTILPCGHMCLCKACAGITSSSWAHQCPVCRGRALWKATDTLFAMIADDESER